MFQKFLEGWNRPNVASGQKLENVCALVRCIPPDRSQSEHILIARYGGESIAFFDQGKASLRIPYPLLDLEVIGEDEKEHRFWSDKDAEMFVQLDGYGQLALQEVKRVPELSPTYIFNLNRPGRKRCCSLSINGTQYTGVLGQTEQEARQMLAEIEKRQSPRR
jgi:hypothetical protein